MKYTVEPTSSGGARITRFVGDHAVQNIWVKDQAAVQQLIQDLSDILRFAVVSDDRVFSYNFTIWPADGSTLSRSTYMVLKEIPFTVTLEFTEMQFKDFAFNLKRDGFELHEVTRVPYFKPEAVLDI